MHKIRKNNSRLIEVSTNTTCSVNSRLHVLGDRIWEVNLMHFNVFCVFWVFFWGGGVEFGILEGKIPPGDSWI